MSLMTFTILMIGFTTDGAGKARISLNKNVKKFKNQLFSRTLNFDFFLPVGQHTDP
jgi:hypothetical protein